MRASIRRGCLLDQGLALVGSEGSQDTHIDVGLARDIVRIGIPKTATAHAHTFASLLPNHHLNHVLIPCEVHLCECVMCGRGTRTGLIKAAVS